MSRLVEPAVRGMRIGASRLGARARFGMTLGLVGCALIGVGTASSQNTPGLPDPCTAVPSADIVSALGLKHAPSSVLASVPNVETCAFANGKLSISVGYTTIANPALPLKSVAVPGLPTGSYRTYAGSTQTEILFFKGTAASGVYGVVRQFVKIKQAKLETIAKALYAAIGQGSGTQTTPSVQLVGGG